jgi:hypothetical protein
MTWSLTNTAAVVAGLAVIASLVLVGRKRLFPGLVTALALAIAAAVLITVARGIG